MDLAEHIIREIDRSWADEVNILGYWEDGPATVCVVYCRTIDPAVVLGVGSYLIQRRRMEPLRASPVMWP